MITLNEWRLKIREEMQGEDGDFTWLRYFFDSVRQTPPGSMVSTLRAKVEQLKDDFARMVAPQAPNPEFKKDVPAAMAKSFAIQLMAATLRLLLPDDSGAGRTLSTRTLRGHMGEEGDDFGYLKRVLGRARVVAPANMITGLRAQVMRLKQMFGEKYGVQNWSESVPEVKQFVMDMLAAVIKTVFPATEASGGGRGVNFQKVAKFTAPTREPDQSMQPPAGMKV